MIPLIKCWIFGHDWKFVFSAKHYGATIGTINLFYCRKCKTYRENILKGNYLE